MTELQTYQNDPNDALLELGPADDDIMHWRAVMKGVPGTAYEGTSPCFIIHHSMRHDLPPRISSTPMNSSLTLYRRHLAPHHLNPAILPSLTPQNPLRHTNLPPKRRLQNRRNLSRPPENVLVARVHHFHHHDQYTPVAYERRAG
jgi:hypothetical protein